MLIRLEGNIRKSLFLIDSNDIKGKYRGQTADLKGKEFPFLK